MLLPCISECVYAAVRIENIILSRGSRSVTMKKIAPYILWVGILAVLALPAFAETRTISWAPVTTYTDGTPIVAGSTVSYTAYWTTDPALGSLHTIGTSIAGTSTTFDPGTQGMTRGGTVYFTVKAVLSSSEVSALSPGSRGSFPWSRLARHQPRHRPQPRPRGSRRHRRAGLS